MGLFNREDKFLKKARKQADQVVALKERFAALDDAALAAKTQEFKHRVQAGESLGCVTARSVRASAGGFPPRIGNGALLCADSGRYYFA